MGHNLKFDKHFSANADIDLGRDCEDTGLNAPMLDEFARSFSLDSCAKAAGVSVKKTEIYKYLASQFGGKDDQSSMGNFWQLAGNDPQGVDYAMGDGTTTLELREWQIHQINEQDMAFIHRVESQLIHTVFRIERRGIKVDASRIAAVEEEVRRRLDIAKLKLPRGFNVRSSTQMKKLFEEAGLTNWPMTEPSTNFPNGQPSFNQRWLKKTDLGQSIIDIRKLTNLGNSFLTPLKERHVFMERVHSQLNQLKSDEYGTISGRFSSSDPNMQQIPKHDEDLGRLFRSVFIPDPGMEFYEGDYSQCEPRLFAHYSQEPALLDGYRRDPPLDMHDVVAKNFECDRGTTAKRMNMGIMTGMQTETFARHMGWDLERASHEFRRWFELFPRIKDFQDKAKGVFKSSGYVRDILKRRLRLESPRFAYRAVSRIIQGSNASIVKERMLKCDEYLESQGDQTHLLMSVHDSLNWQAPKGSVGEAHSAELVRISCDVQRDPFNLRVPFVMDVGHGSNWGIATYGELPS